MYKFTECYKRVFRLACDWWDSKGKVRKLLATLFDSYSLCHLAITVIEDLGA